MTTDQIDQTVVTQTPTPAGGQETVQTERRHVTSSGPGGSEMTRRIIIFGFGLVQLVIAARIVLLLVDAREANGLVSGILNVSQLFVAPFEGISARTAFMPLARFSTSRPSSPSLGSRSWS